MMSIMRGMISDLCFPQFYTFEENIGCGGLEKRWSWWSGTCGEGGAVQKGARSKNGK